MTQTALIPVMTSHHMFELPELRHAFAMSDAFLTSFEVATIMRVSKRTVYRLVHAGDLEAIKVTGSLPYP